MFEIIKTEIKPIWGSDCEAVDLTTLSDIFESVFTSADRKSSKYAMEVLKKNPDRQLWYTMPLTMTYL